VLQRLSDPRSGSLLELNVLVCLARLEFRRQIRAGLAAVDLAGDALRVDSAVRRRAHGQLSCPQAGLDLEIERARQRFFLRLLALLRDLDELLELDEPFLELDVRLLVVLRLDVLRCRVEPRFEPRFVCPVERFRVPDDPCPAP
jgi:hypothetical protein